MSIGRNADIERAAIDLHSETAETFFVSGHDLVENQEYFATPFVYGRWRLRTALDSLIGDVACGALVDIGCGTGDELALYAARGFSVTGVEPAAGMREAAAHRHPQLAGRILEGNIYDLPLDDESADFVLAIEVMRYIEDFRTAAREIARVLRPGGRWLFSVTPPTNWTLGPLLTSLRCRGVPLPFIQKVHQYWHSERYLRRTLGELGLRAGDIHPLNYIGFATSLAAQLSPKLGSLMLRAWHPLWGLMERKRMLGPVAGYYLVEVVKHE